MATVTTIDTQTQSPFGAYICDELTSQILLPIISAEGWPAEMIFSGGIAKAIRTLGAMPCPEFLIIDLSESDDPRADMQSLAEVCEPGTVVITLGTLNDVTLYRDLLHAGVHDYLVKPVTADMLEDAIMSARAVMEAEDEPPVPQNNSVDKQIGFIGLRGGLGASTLAANIAWLSAEKNSNTVLLDLDLFFGTSAVQFDLEPGRGLADALENPDRIDGLFLERAVVKPHDKLSILGTEAAVGSISEPDEEALSHLLDGLTTNFNIVIVDLPRQLLGHHSEIIKDMTDIVLVTDYSLVAARDCIRLIAHIRKIAANVTIHVVVNKTGMTTPEVEPKDFENSIETPVSITVPYDAKAFLEANQEGKPVVSKASKAAQAIQDLAKRFGDADTETEKSSWFAKLLKR